MRLLSIIALLAAGILAGTQLGKIAPLVGWYQQEIGFSLVLTGWFTAMIGIFVALAALPTGWAIERVGTRRSFVIASVVLVAGGIALAFLRSPAAILAARLVEGLGYLVLVIAIPALLNSIPAPKWRAPALAVWGGFVPLGYAVGDYLARATDATSEPGRYLLAAILLFALFAALAAMLLACVPDHGDAPSRVTGAFGGFAATMTLPVVIVALAFGLYVILSLGFFAFLPAFVDRSASTIAFAAGAISLTVPLGNVLAGLLVRGGARGALLIAAFGFAATALAAWPAFAVSSQVTATISIVLLAVAGGVIASALFAAIPAVVPPGGSAAIAIGLVCQAGGIGTVIGPPLAAHVIESYSWTGFALFMVAVCVAAVAALAPLLFGRSLAATASAPRL